MTGEKLTKNLMIKAAVTLAAVIIAAAAVVMAGFSSAPRENWDSWGRHEKQYEELTQALLMKRLSIPEEPAAFLAEMDNPYDPVERSIASAENDSYALIDTAYYNGKYYIYFGVTPALLFYIPLKIITGRIPPTWAVDIFAAVLCVPAAFLFVAALCRRFYPRSSLSVRIILSFILISVLGVPYLAAFCTTYSVPAVTGLFLVLTGLSCFLLAERAAAASGKDPGSEPLPVACVSPVLLITGSVLIALSVGCRPVFGAAFLMAFPIFAGPIKNGAFFRAEKKAVLNTVCVIIPALIIGGCLLAYNYLRFGNPFEFGFKYLFTTRDMLHGQRSLGEALATMRLLFLEPPVLRTVFPYMDVVTYRGAFADTLYVEPMFGGLIPLHIFLTAGLSLLVVLPLFLRRYKASRKAFSGSRPLVFTAVMSLVLGFAVLITDSMVAGVSQRYESDFALFFFIPAAAAVLNLENLLIPDEPLLEITYTNLTKRFRIILVIALLAVLVSEVSVTAMTILCDGRYFAMIDTNPAVYEAVRHILAP